jgi:hypothetical protein
MPKFRVLALSALPAFAFAALAAQGAAAQSAACADGGKLMQDRGALIQTLAESNKSKKKMTPDQACGRFNALVGNGTKLIAWLE